MKEWAKRFTVVFRLTSFVGEALAAGENEEAAAGAAARRLAVVDSGQYPESWS